jgi:hypothetical protein
VRLDLLLAGFQVATEDNGAANVLTAPVPQGEWLENIRSAKSTKDDL